MVRQSKNGNFYVDCSHCKWSVGVFGTSEEEAIEEAEKMGYAVVGKFHFCPACFSNMLERWKMHNKEVLSECG